MKTNIHNFNNLHLTFALLVAQLWVPAILFAEQDILVQQRGGELVTGLADRDMGEFVIGAGQSIFTRQAFVLAGERFTADEPGFNSVTNPSGEPPAFVLPGNQPLGFNALPFRIGSQTGNLFFWDGKSGSGLEDVDFLPAPPGTTLTIQSAAESAVLNGTNTVVPGFTIAETSEAGELHTHLDWEVVDFNGPPTDGFYLFSLELTMPGLKSSAPIYLALGRQNPYEFQLPPSPFFEFANYWDPREEAVAAWIAENLVAPSGRCGDLDSDDDVDSADLIGFLENWTGSLDPGEGTSTFEHGDCDRDGDIDSADVLRFLEAWTGSSAALGPVAVPEPTGALTGASGLLAWGVVRRRGRRRGRRD